MMNATAQAEFERITSIPEIVSLTPEDISFLKARRAYLNPAQRLAYEELELFGKNEKSLSVDEQGRPNPNDLTEEELAGLESEEASKADADKKDKKKK